MTTIQHFDRMRLDSCVGSNPLWVDVHRRNNGEVLTAEMHRQFYRVQLRVKEGIYGLVGFAYDVEEKDMGWWKDAEIVWDSKEA